MRQSKKNPAICILLMVGWCLLFVHCRTTEKSMIRAVFLQQIQEGYQVGLLYHSLQPSADASEVETQACFVFADAETMERAFAKAEEQLPAQANYRICDFLLLPTDTQEMLLSEYETLVLRLQCGRTAGCICFLAGDGTDLEKDRLSLLSGELLENLERDKQQMPCLYQWMELYLSPVFRLGEDAVSSEETILHAGGEKRLIGNDEANLLRLLTGENGKCDLWLDDKLLRIRKCVVSVTLYRGRIRMVLDCQSAYGAPAPTQTQLLQLQELCTQTVCRYWEQETDLLALEAKSSLWKGAQGALRPTKNACLQLQTDVRFWG